MPLLPPEILIAIFGLAHTPSEHFFDMDQAPWLPSRVCRSWREAACSAPELWSTLSFEYTHGLETKVGRPPFRCLATRFLELSRDHTLKIRLVALDAIPAHVERSLMEILWPHRARWEELQMLVFRSKEVIRGMEQQADPSQGQIMTSLRQISLGLNYMDDQTAAATVALFRDIPSLDSVFLQGFPGSTTPSPVTRDLLWTNVRSLVLGPHASYPPAFSSLLTGLPSLVYLHHETNYRPDETAELPPQGYHFPHLQGMFIQADIGLSQTTAPHLEALKVGYCSPRALISFVTRSGCLLQSLHLSSSTTGPPFLWEILDHLPSLVLLSITNCDAPSSHQVLRYLSGGGIETTSRSRRSTLPCPALKHLRLFTIGTGQGVQHTPSLHIFETIADWLDIRFPLDPSPTSNSTSRRQTIRPMTQFRLPSGGAVIGPKDDNVHLNRSPKATLRFLVIWLGNPMPEQGLPRAERLQKIAHNLRASGHVDVEIGISDPRGGQLGLRSLLPGLDWTEFSPAMPHESAWSELMRLKEVSEEMQEASENNW